MAPLFRVWIRPLGNACRLRVDGLMNAQWLLNRLSQSFVFKTSQAVVEEHDSSYCTFQVAYSSRVPRLTLDRLLAAIPEVQVMEDPA